MRFDGDVGRCVPIVNTGWPVKRCASVAQARIALGYRRKLAHGASSHLVVDCNRARVELDYAIHRGVVAPPRSLSLSLLNPRESRINAFEENARRVEDEILDDSTSFRRKSLSIQIVRISEEIYIHDEVTWRF